MAEPDPVHAWYQLCCAVWATRHARATDALLLVLRVREGRKKGRTHDPTVKAHVTWRCEV